MTIDFLNVATLGDATSQRLVVDAMRKHLDNLIAEGGDFLAAIKKLETSDTVAPEWMEDSEHPWELTAQLEAGSPATLTFSGTVLGDAISRTILDQYVRPYTILQKFASGAPVQVQVTAFTSPSSLVAQVVAYGNTSLSYDVSGTTWTILGSAGADSQAFQVGMGVERDYRKTFTQIFQEYIEMDKTRQNLGMKNVANEFQHQLDKIVRYIRRQLALACIHGRPYYTGGDWKSAFDYSRATMAGVFWWIEKIQAEKANTATWVNAAGKKLTQVMLENLAASGRDSEWVNFKTGKWGLWMNHAKYRLCQKFERAYRRTDADRRVANAMNMEEIELEGKAIPFNTDFLWRPDAVVLCREDQLGWGDFKNDALSIDDHPSVPRQKKKEVNFQPYGLLARMPRHILGIYNLGD